MSSSALMGQRGSATIANTENGVKHHQNDSGDTLKNRQRSSSNGNREPPRVKFFSSGSQQPSSFTVSVVATKLTGPEELPSQQQQQQSPDSKRRSARVSRLKPSDTPSSPSKSPPLSLATEGLPSSGSSEDAPLTTVSLQQNISLMEDIKCTDKIYDGLAAVVSPLPQHQRTALAASNGRRKADRPRRAVPVPDSFLDRINHKIIRLYFPEMERRHCEYYDQPHHHYTAYVTADANQPTVMQRTNQQKRSSFETYLSSLLSFYRSKPRIHRLRMRRRHDRILSRASHNHKASKDSATRASRRLQSTEQQQQQFELSTGHEWHAADELPLENEEVYYDEQHSDFGYNDNQAPSVAGSYQQQQQQPKRKRGRPRKQNSDKQQQPQDGGLNHFLDDEEQELCTSLNLSLEEYLKAKQKFREAFETQGPFRKTASRRLVPHLEIPVISKLYDHFVRINLIIKV